MAYDFKKKEKQFYQATSISEIVDVPAMNYLTIRGTEDPNEEDGDYQKAINLLNLVSYTLKTSYKANHFIEGFVDYVIPPLEAFWWQEGVKGFDYKNKKNKTHWILCIRVPDFIKKKDFVWAIKETTHKKQLDCSSVTFHRMDEGLCAQMLHMGSFEEESQTIKQLSAFIDESGYVCDTSAQRFHHEIYLSDAKKVSQDQMKRIIRLPIKKK